MWSVFLLTSEKMASVKDFLPVFCLMAFAVVSAPLLQADEEVFQTPQTYIVIADSAPLMVGDDPAGVLQLGTVVTVTRAQGAWRYCPDRTGWVHLRDLVPLEQAVETFSTEIQRKPTARAYQLRGIAYLSQEQWAKAAQDFEQAYDLGESAVALHLNLGACYERLGQMPAAMQEYDSILETYPDDVSASLARGNLLLMQGQFQAALRDLTKATQLNPKSAEAWNARGVSLRMLGRYEKAIRSYSKAIELDQTDPDARANRGYARKQIGKLAEALEDYEAALTLAPDSAAIRNDLAWFLATTSDDTLRDSKRAVELSEAICQETRNENGEYLDTLSAAYASLGRFPAAVEAARLALTVLGQNPGAARIQDRLALYQQKKPYVEAIEAVIDPVSLPEAADQATEPAPAQPVSTKVSS